MIRKLIILVLLLLPLTALGQTQYFVGGTGASNSNDGLAATVTGGHGPWLTINHAIAAFTLGAAGATINVANGTYVDSQTACGPVSTPMSFCINRGGASATQPLLLQCTNGLNGNQGHPTSGNTGGPCKLRESGNPTNSAIMWIAGANWVTLQGFDLGGDPTNLATQVKSGLTIHAKDGNGHNLTIKGNYIHDVSSVANDGNGLGNGCPSEGVVVVNANNNGSAIPAGNKYIGNFINNGGTLGNTSCNQYHGMYLQGAQMTVENNIVGNTPGAGLKIYPDVCSSVVSNNTVFHNGWWGILVKDGGSGTSGCTANGLTVGVTSINNNIAIQNGFNTACGGITTQAGQPANSYRNNILLGNFAAGANDNIVQMNSSASCTGTAWPGTVGTLNGSNGLTLANTLVNYQVNGQGDYHLQTGSQGIQGGSATCVSGGVTPCIPSTDFSGTNQSSPPSIGAYTVATVPVGTITFTPSPLAFPLTTVGACSAIQFATVKNTGSVNVSLNSLTTIGSNPGDFPPGNIGTCSLTTPLASLASCTWSKMFCPVAGGSRTATLQMTDSAVGSPHSVALTGTGGVPVVSLSVTNMPFGSVQLGSTSAIQTSTLTNTGNGQLNIASIGFTGTDTTQFTQSNTCGATVAAGANCAIQVTFKPTTLGAKSASVSITDNAAGSPQAITLSGTGAGTANPGMSPTSLTFSNQLVGTTSASAQVVTLTNNGNAPLTISSIGASGDFSQTNNCPLSPNTLAAAPNSPISCTINVKFSPTAPGNRSGTLTATSNAPGSPTTAALSGTGIQGAISLSPTSLTFAGMNVGTSSSSQRITITNSGSANVNISSVTLAGLNPGDYSLVATGCTALTPTSTCTADITFTPTATGSRTATLSVADDAPLTPQTATLTGTGTAPVVSLTPSSVAFGSQITGTVSAATNLTLSNTGNGDLTIASIALTGIDITQFTQSGNCGATLVHGTNCTIGVRFAPTTAGSKSASLTVTDNATGSPHSSTLTGTGVAGTPVALLTPSSLNYASTIIGVPSATQTATLQNTGTADLTFSSIAISGDYSQTNNCISPIVAPTSCSIFVKFTPTAVGTRTGTLTVNDNASGHPHTVALSGIGATSGGGGGIAVISPSSLAFGSQIVGTPSAVQVLTLKNTDTVSMTVNSVDFTGNPTDYSETDNCKPTLGAGASCTVNVTFTPTTTGARPANVRFTDSSAGSPQLIPVTGNGIPPFGVVNVVPTSLNFGSAQATTTTPPQTIKITNVGTATLNISGITKTGTNPTEYNLTNPCGSTLAISAFCTLSITFTPSTTGTRTANISIASSDPNSPTIVPMTGVGTPAPAPHVQLSASFLTFPLTQTGNTTPTQSVIVSNIGDANLAISAITLQAPNATDYVLTNPCGFLLAPSTNCTLQVAFRPIAGGTRTSGVSIADNASDTPQVISLTGNAFVGTPTADLSTSTITFTPSQIILTTSGQQSILLTNNGNAALAITSVTASSDLSPGSSEFVQTNNCGSSVPAHGSCTTNVTFTPQATGARTGKVTYIDNAVGGSQVVILMGTGINPPPPPGNSATGMGGSAGMGGKVGMGVH